MAVTQKPNKSNKFIKQEKLVDDIISKGGSSPTYDIDLNQHKKNDKNMKMTIRIPIAMVRIIDSYLKNSINTKARNYWIKEAIEEKINRDITRYK